MGGKRLLIIGGAGFLGYYLVQAVLHWNAQRGCRQPIRCHRVRQLHPRHAGLAVRARTATRTSSWSGTTSPTRCPRTCRTSSTSSTRARSPRRSTTGSIRSRPWTPTSTGCASCSTTQCASRHGRARRGLPVLLEQRDLRRPDPENDPDARDTTAATSPARARAPATTSPSATARPCA